MDITALNRAMWMDIILYASQYRINHGKPWTIYLHNNSSFDLNLYLHDIATQYQMELLIHNGTVMILSVSLLGQIVLQVKDSILLMPSSLKRLGKAYQVEQQKLFSPNLFLELTAHNGDVDAMLNYVGPKPPIAMYEPERGKITQAEYDALPDTWSFKDDGVIYLRADCVSLYQILQRYLKEASELSQLDPLLSASVPSLALKTWRTRFKPPGISVLNLHPSVDRLIRPSYVGGLSELFQPYGENLYHYDINSMYAWAMTNSLPVGNINIIDNNAFDLNNFKGFVKCTVYAPYHFIPFLSIRHGGRLVSPVGRFTGYWYSEELRVAVEQGGYQILEVHLAIAIDHANIFNDYVHFFNDIKSSNTGPRREIAKLYNNSLYGRLGMAPVFTISKFFKPSDKLPNTIVNLVNFEGVDLITYDNKADRLDHSEVINTNVAIASAITALSRMRLRFFINMVGQEHVWYCDTDSIVTDIELPAEYVGPGLGMMKLEQTIDRAYFCSPKVYCEVLTDGTLHRRCKGYNASLLSDRATT